MPAATFALRRVAFAATGRYAVFDAGLGESSEPEDKQGGREAHD